MAKRKKRNKGGGARGKNARVSLSQEQLEQAARQSIASAQYKLAIQHLKNWSKQAQQSARTDTISVLFREAYSGRAEQLANRGMVKEALAIWEVAKQYGLSVADPRYIQWLLQTRRYADLLRTYQDIPVEQRKPLQPYLGAALLAGDTMSLAKVTEDDPVVKGYESARILLEAWCSGADEEQLSGLMKAIPFRSPYRDLRQVIQCWLLQENGSGDVSAALQRIADDSPYKKLVEPVSLVQMDGAARVSYLSKLPPIESKVALGLLGWSDTDEFIRNKLDALESVGSAGKVFAAVQAIYKKTRPGYLSPSVLEWLAGVLKRAWVLKAVETDGPLDWRSLENTLGTLSALEKRHLLALFDKADRASISELFHSWLDYRKELNSGKHQVPPEERSLRSALVQRYLAEVWESYNGKHTKRSIAMLEDALVDDFDEQAGWVTVIEFYLQERKLKPARDHLNEALEHFPNDVALLELGIRVAIAGNTFKKAATYAKRILEVDPINTKVQQHLQNAHIAHARKVFKQNKWHLVSKELDDARTWKGSALNKVVIETLAALQEWAASEHKISDQLQRLAAEQQQSELIRLDFVLRHETSLLGLSEHKVLDVAGIAGLWKVGLWKKPKKDYLLSLVETARQFMAVDANSVVQPLNGLYAALAKAVKLKFTAQEGEQLCEFWLQAKQKRLLADFSRKLQKAWPDKPVFTYYRYVNSHYDFAAIPELERAWHKARDQGDNALSARITDLLEKLTNPFGNRFKPDDDDFFPGENDDEMFDPLEPLPDDLSLDMMSDMIGFLAGEIDNAPLDVVKDLANSILGESTTRIVLEQYGERALRDLVGSGLRGEDPEEAINRLVAEKNKKLPFVGELF